MKLWVVEFKSMFMRSLGTNLIFVDIFHIFFSTSIMNQLPIHSQNTQNLSVVETGKMAEGFQKKIKS
jgi:hypothetical protein